MEQRNEQEIQAQVDIWKYIFGFKDMAIVRCAIELGIPDILENQAGRPMSLPDLSSAVGCPPSTLYRVMRFLVNRRIFHEETIVDHPMSSHSKGYVKTPLSCLLTKNGDKSMAPLIMFESNLVTLSPWMGLSKRVITDSKSHAFEDANGKDIWSYMEANFGYKKLFHDAMACGTRSIVSVLIESYPELFRGLDSLVDVGGGNSTTMRLLIKAFPGIRGIVFDLPHVIVDAVKCDDVENIGGDMFHSIPKAHASILHDWKDEECIKILKNCRQAISENKGKVIIVEAIILEKDEDKMGERYGFEYARLMMDMVMLAETETGKERTMKEWEFLLTEAGFSQHRVHHIQALESVIVAYP